MLDMETGAVIISEVIDNTPPTKLSIVTFSMIFPFDALLPLHVLI